MKQFRDTMYEYNTLTEEYRTKSKDRIRRQLELGGCHISTGVYLTATIWPEILVANLFWQIDGFESNPFIFHPPKNFTV